MQILGDIGTMHTIGGMKNLVAVRQPEEMPQIVEEDGTLTPVQCAYIPYSLLNRELPCQLSEHCIAARCPLCVVSILDMKYNVYVSIQTHISMCVYL